MTGPADERPGAPFWVGLTVGWMAIGFGLLGIFDHPSAANPVKVLRLMVGLNIANDAVVVPVVLVLAVIVRRWAPGWLVMPIQVWCIVSGVVCVYAYPLVRHFGGRADNPSLLPHDYANNLLIVLGGITAVCCALAAASWRRDHTTPR